MQLPLTTDGLVPVGVGLVVAIAIVILILFAYRRNRAFHSPDPPGPGPADWTGSSANRAVQPAPAALVSEPGVGSTPPVAHAADAGAGPETRPSPDQTAGVSDQRKEAQRAGHPASDVVTTGEPPPWASSRTRADATPDAGPIAAKSNGADDPAARNVSEARALPTDATGSSRTVAAAVAQAFAVRAASARRSARQSAAAADNNTVPSGDTDRDATPPVDGDHNGGLSGSGERNGGLSGNGDHKAPPSSPPTTRADARDRLLAVLLNDPVRAVGATEELEACRNQLRDVMHRLVGTGLRPEQLARLAGLPLEDVQALLAPVASRVP